MKIKYSGIVALIGFSLLLAGPLLAGELAPVQKTVLKVMSDLDPEVERISQVLWEYSEIALEETKSAAFLADLLEKEGFRLRRGVADMPTAFVAEYGEGRPILGVLAEYDALPGIGNGAVPRREAREDLHAHGQGCGHNVFGAGSVGAALALKRTLEKHGDIQGTIRLYGTPAEETVVGKVYMAKAGLFDDLDAALVWHPGLETMVDNQAGLALNNFTVEYFGQAAHGAFDPWHGRSALDAVELLNHGVNLMREHIEPTARIHYVIQNGGEAPNVVPDYAKVWYYVRDLERDKVEQHYAWILDIAAAGAQATQTRHEVFLNTGVHSALLNRPLQEAAMRNLEIVGAPAYSDEDQAFARELQEFLKLEAKGLKAGIEPLVEGIEVTEGGSSDVAEVSRITPTVSIIVTSAAEGLPWHSWATAASHGAPGAWKAAAVAARVMALTGADLLTDDKLLEKARSEFESATEGKPYRSPVPEGQKAPLP